MFKKKVQFKKGVPVDFVLLLGAFLFIALAVMFRQSWILVCMVILFAVLFFRRYFCGKLVLKASDLVLFWGLPGSGKTLMMTKVAKDNKDLWYIGVNEEYSHLKLKDFVYTRDEMAQYNFPLAALFFDEASLNGFDNREFAKNFKDPAMLETFKKHRQMDMPMVLSNQGFEECDIKIRQSLANKVYYVEDRGLWCRATIMIKDVTISEIDGKPIEGYRFPTILERLMDPHLVLYAVPWYYGKFYSTKSPPKRLSFPALDFAKSIRTLKR